METLEAHRGRGYATDVTAAWAHAVHRRGFEPLYSTSRGNAASLSVARRLGLVCYGEDLHIAEAGGVNLPGGL